jgi:hypothetical protein
LLFSFIFSSDSGFIALQPWLERKLDSLRDASKSEATEVGELKKKLDELSEKVKNLEGLVSAAEKAKSTSSGGSDEKGKDKVKE